MKSSILIFLSLGWLLSCGRSDTATASDARNANKVLMILREQVTFPIESKFRKNGDTLYTKPMHEACEIILSGYYKKEDQNQLLEKMKAALQHEAVPLNKVIFLYYEFEPAGGALLRREDFQLIRQ